MAVPESRLRHHKVALILNAHSRKARREANYVRDLERAFGDRGPFIASQSPSELPEATRDILRAEPDLIFIAGGDGTLRQTLTHLMATYDRTPLPKIAILKGGTMNTVATSLGIYNSPQNQMERLLHSHDQAIPLTIARRPLLKVNNHFGFIFGLGGFSRFIEHYQTEKDPTPRWAFTLLAKTILSMIGKGEFAETFFVEFPVNLWRDNKPWLQNTRVTNISASTIRHIGFQFKPYFGAEEAEDSLGLLIFRTVPRRLLVHLPHFLLGRQVSDPTMDQVPAREILIKTDAPMRPMLDGDILKAEQTFDVRTGPVLDLVVG